MAILYEIKYKEEIFYYESILTIDFSENIILKQNWNEIPKSIVNFYTNVHREERENTKYVSDKEVQIKKRYEYDGYGRIIKVEKEELETIFLYIG